MQPPHLGKVPTDPLRIAGRREIRFAPLAQANIVAA